MSAFLRGVLIAGCAAVGIGCSAVGSSLDGFTGGGGLGSVDGGDSTGAAATGAGTDPDTPVVCMGSVCAPCPRPLAACTDRCVDIRTDEANCGACHAACVAGQTCVAGACRLVCPAGQMECDGACVETSINVKHCGQCSAACATGEACVDGACAVVCAGGQRVCDDRCTDTTSDNRHCGRCNRACAGGLVCSTGECAISCAPGLTECGGRCVNRKTDESHCGKCGRTCDANQACKSGACVLSCTASLDEPVTDSWAYVWDGLDRAAAAYAQAEKVCSDLGGRLPTATEIHRVSAAQSSSVGQMVQTNPLWSLVPFDATRQHALRLSDGGSVAQDLASTLAYRCVCPDSPDRIGFAGDSCNGPPGNECMALASGNGRLRIDRNDRATVSKAGAVWECAFHDAHLAPVAGLVEAIHQEATGSNLWLHTADDAEYRYDTLLRWDGAPGAAWVPAQGTTLSYGSTDALRPFRCEGSNSDTGTYPASVPNQFVPSKGRGFKGERDDTTTTGAASYIDAIAACWNRGGHLPTSTQLAELIQAGLPNGSGNWLWTTDGVGYHSVTNMNFLNVVLKWSGTGLRFDYSSPAVMTWAWKTTADFPYRCVYFPVDSDYAGPASGACEGGCTEFLLPGSSGARLWVDATDRVASPWETAADLCRQEGGRLPHERDFAETIRQGLPNGSANWLWTTDFGIGNGTSVNAMVVKWAGQDAAFSDQYSGYMTWSGFGTARAFRCLWTNEVR